MPIVIFNGPGRWSAPTDLSSLVQTPAAWLRPFQPEQRYCLVDPSLENLDIPGNFAAALFRLARARNPQEVHDVLLVLAEPLKDPALSWLREDFTLFALWKLRRSLPNTTIPLAGNLPGMLRMLEEETVTWEEQWQQEGQLRGELQGERKLLRRLLEKRFGAPLPSWAEEKLGSAAEEELMRWAERAMQHASAQLEQIMSE